MSSFYGNGTVTIIRGVTPGEISAKIQDAKNHVIFSKVQPTVQKAGDIWVVIDEFENKKENNNG